MIPTIATQFGALDQQSWLSVTFFLAQLITRPFYGRMCDVIGRRIPLLVSIFVFALGSGLSAASQNFSMLVFFRAVEAAGAGGINTSFNIIIADLVPLKHRGKWQSYVEAAFIVTAVAAPYIGGTAIASSNWRYVFIGTCAITILFGIVIMWKLKLPSPLEKGDGKKVFSPKNIDYFGIVLSIVSAALLSTGLQIGGSLFAWDSSVVIGLLVSGSILFVAFVVYDGWFISSNVAIIPFKHIFEIRNCAVVFGISILLVVATSVSTYQATFYQLIAGVSVTLSGYIDYADTVGSVVFSIGVSWLLSLHSKTDSRARRIATAPKTWFIVGSVLLLLGLLLMGFRLTTSSSVGELILQQALIGIGTGCVTLILLLSAQQAVGQSGVAVITSTYFFVRSLGGLIGNALLATVYNSRLSIALIDRLPPGTNATVLAAAKSRGLTGVPRNLVPLAILAYQDTSAWVHLTASAIMLIALIFGIVFLVPFDLSDDVKDTGITEQVDEPSDVGATKSDTAVKNSQVSV
ncbi:major facilitator superfamily domain-containing protein [Cladochytrium replicatum]|nr:major facilitator superfamily domain-containing protein [Cladochytrium replicatum]